jgi:hypothetical protein
MRSARANATSIHALKSAQAAKLLSVRRIARRVVSGRTSSQRVKSVPHSAFSASSDP